MKAVTLGKCKTLVDIENCLRKIEKSDQPFLLKKDGINSRNGALNDASRLQMLVTLARRANHSHLRFNAQNDAESLSRYLCEYSPGIAALRLSKGFSIGDNQVDRREALVPAGPKMEDTDNERYDRIIAGRSLDFICVAGSQVEFLRPLFDARSKTAVKDKSDMIMLMKKLLQIVAKQSSTQISDTFASAMGIFAHELLKNTQEHARTDHRDNPYSSHVEGMILSVTKLDDRIFAEDYEGHHLLKDFWGHESFTSGTDKRITGMKGLQISFFDAGPGFVGRASGKLVKDMSIANERETLINCLKLHFTSKDETGAGKGLPLVLTKLREFGGLLRIRTGRLSIFNVFEVNGRNDLFDFKDWTTEPLAPVEGSIVSIILPLRA